jgi:hypothetical protein
MEPRKVVGSVDTSEFVVTVAASLGFLIALGGQGISFGAVAALLVGGLIAAPIAAWLVRHIPGRILGSLVGGVIVLTNVRTILRSDSVAASSSTQAAAYILIAVVWVAAVAWSLRSYLAERDELAVASDSEAAEPATT